MNNYTELALRTESKPTLEMRERMLAHIRLQHGVWGIVTEAIELNDHTDHTNLAEECGDLEWYLALVRDAIGLKDGSEDEEPIERYGSTLCCVERIVSLAGEMADVIKGFIFYSDPKRFWKLRNQISELENCLIEIYDYFDLTRAAVREKNIAKLAKRYGDKFSDYLAVNRDLDAERIVLADKGSGPGIFVNSNPQNTVKASEADPDHHETCNACGSRCVRPSASHPGKFTCNVCGAITGSEKPNPNEDDGDDQPTAFEIALWDAGFSIGQTADIICTLQQVNKRNG